jgi:lipopolysaccharide/colanic/teichoic acid biosynthesis glycosyltransferase
MSTTASMLEPIPEPGRPAALGGHTSSSAEFVYVTVKAFFDFVLALILLVLTAPLLLLAVVLVKLTSRGPAIYTQTRLGLHGRPFTLFKVRTMTHDCERASGACWSLPGDSRVTAVGRWLRRTHLDELPQLWNVLSGDMSLIGPRPERPEFVPQLEQAIPHYVERLQVRPGVTGLAQVQLPPDTNLDSVRTKLAYDLHYVKNMSMLLDARIYWATFFKMLGVRFATIEKMFGFPRRESIELEYRSLPARSSPKLRTLVATRTVVAETAAADKQHRS